MTGVLGGAVGVAPVIDDPETAGIFHAAASGRLVVQECLECGNRQQPPRPRCLACHGTDLDWADLPQEGEVHTWTVVAHQIHPNFVPPYTVVLVDVAPVEGAHPVRFVGYLPGTPELSVGTRVRTTFEEVAPGVWLPNWALVSADRVPADADEQTEER